MRLFILGGGGMIGQAIARLHLKHGDEVAIWDNKSNPYADYSNLVGQAYDTRITPLDVALRDFQPEVISNQAAHVSVGQSQAQPYSYWFNNLGVTADLVQALTDKVCEPKLIVHGGSMGPYGEGVYAYYAHVEDDRNVFGPRTKIGPPVTGDNWGPSRNQEDDPLLPVSQYAATKRAQEEALRIYAESGGVTVVSLRYFSVYSLTANPLNPYTGVLSVLANKCLNADAIELNEDGMQTRDLVSDEDCALAHAFMCSESHEHAFSAYNVGTGIRTRLMDVAGKMRGMLAPNKDIRTNQKLRRGDIYHSCANTTKLDKFGYRTRSSLGLDIDLYCRFIEANREKFTIGKDTAGEAQAELAAKGLLK